jgi:O-antigen/teichoic acid export membrane protein
VFVFAILILVWIAMPIYKIQQISTMQQYVPFLMVLVFLLAFYNLFQGMMLSLKNYLSYNIFAFGLGLALFLGAVLVNFSPHYEEKLSMAIRCYLAGYAIMFFFGLRLIITERHKLSGGMVPKLSFFEQIRVGLRGYISSLSALLLFRLDLFLVAYFLTFKEVGVYSIALFCAEMIVKIPNWSASILTPMVASSEEGYVRKTLYLFYTSIVLAMVLGFFIVVTVKLFPMLISDIIGKDFVGVGICLLFLLPRVIMQSGVAIIAANLAGKGYPWYHPLGCSISLLFVIILDLILIPELGIIGAAIGNSLSFVSAVVVFMIGFRKYNEITEDSRLRVYWFMMLGRMQKWLTG